MATAEQVAFSIREEGRGVHVVLWDDQADLVRALLVVTAGLKGIPIYGLLVPDRDEDLISLRSLADSRTVEEENDALKSPADSLWLLFIPPAASKRVGPWLNGWRRPLSQPPGTLLAVRHADFESFQRNAPDLASYFGPRIYDAATMISVWSKETDSRLESELAIEIQEILKRLPGTPPSKSEIDEWRALHSP